MCDLKAMMFRRCALFFILCCAALPSLGAGPLIVGYFPFWSAYSHGTTVADVSVERLTHLVYGVGLLRADGELVGGDTFADLVKVYEGPDNRVYRGNFAIFPLLRARNPQLKIMLSVGGWDRSQHFSAVAADPQKRARFVASASAFLDRYGFDGIELDWRFPVLGSTSDTGRSPDDLKNFRLLLREFRTEFNRRSASRLLAITLGPRLEQRAGWDYADMAVDVDFVTLIATEFAGLWDQKTGHKAPLASTAKGVPSVKTETAEIKAGGLPAAKMVLLVPAVGVSWLGVPPTNQGLGQPFRLMSLGVSDNELAKTTGTFTLSEIVRLTAGGEFVQQWDDVAKAETLYQPRTGQLISYESRRSLAAKLDFVDTEGLAGVGLWYLSADADKTESLLDQIHAHSYPWSNRKIKLRDGFGLALPWLLGVLLGLSLAAGGTLAVWLIYRRRRQDEDAGHRALASSLQTLPSQLYIAAAEVAAARAHFAGRLSPQQLGRLDEMASLSLVMRQQLLVFSPAPTPVIEVIAHQSSRDALLALERFTREIASERSLEKMLDTMMHFLSDDGRVRQVVLQEDDGKEAATVSQDDVMALDAKRTSALIEHEMLADYRVSVSFHAPLSEEDEVYFRSLGNQIVLIRQQLQEVARQPQLLAELYEVAKRRDKLHFIRAERGYSGIHAADCETPIYITLRLRALRLYFAELVPVHRSYLVRPQAVTGSKKLSGGGIELIVGGKSVPVARAAIAKLRQQYPGWFQ